MLAPHTSLCMRCEKRLIHVHSIVYAENDLVNLVCLYAVTAQSNTACNTHEHTRTCISQHLCVDREAVECLHVHVYSQNHFSNYLSGNFEDFRCTVLMDAATCQSYRPVGLVVATYRAALEPSVFFFTDPLYSI